MNAFHLCFGYSGEYRVKGVVIYYHIIALTAIPLLAIMARDEISRSKKL